MTDDSWIAYLPVGVALSPTKLELAHARGLLIPRTLQPQERKMSTAELTTPTTPTIDDRIAARRAELTKQRAERLDELDLPRTMTQREVNTYLADTAVLHAKIEVFNATADMWAALPDIERLKQWIADCTVWRPTLTTKLLDIKSPIRDRAIRDLALALGFSIELIDRGWKANRLPTPIIDLSSNPLGQLMAAAGYDTVAPALYGPNGFLCSLPEAERRLKEMTSQRTAIEAALDTLVLTDAERAEREAEGQAHRDAINRLHIRLSADGGSLVLVDAYGEPRDLASLTPAERTAFDRADADQRAFRQSVVERQARRGSL